MSSTRLAALGVVWCVCVNLFAEVAVQTSDGLKLILSEKGRVTACQLGEQTLPLIRPGGFAVIDYRNQPEPKNLVSNAGFEEGSQGWSLGHGQEIDRSVAHSGVASARITIPGPLAGSSTLNRIVEVKPNTRYLVGLWMRRHQCGVCGAYVSELDKDGKLCGKVTQIGLQVPKEDDVWHFAKREIETGPRTAKLLLRGDIYRSTGAIWLDDYTICELGPPVSLTVEGETRPDSGRVNFTAEMKEANLTVEAVFSSQGQAIRVDGVVKDRSRKDRALGLRFELPFDATGWTWWEDLEDRRTVAEPISYRHTYKCESGEGMCSIYPWSALTGAEAGLSLALPLDQGPRVFLIEYDNGRRAYSVTFFLGLSPLTNKFPSRASFSFVLYRHDAAWGMRSATARYYELFPDHFKKRPTYEGYLNYANLERLDPKTHRLNIAGAALDDASDFGEGYRALWHLHGCYDFRMYHTPNAKLPPDAEVLEFLRTLVEKEKKNPSSYCPTEDTIKKIVYDAEGRFRYIGDTQYWKAHEGYNHTDRPGWGLNFRVNEDPDVSYALARKTREALEKYAQEADRQPFDACLTADAIEGYGGNTAGLDYRPEHIRVCDFPLTFGRESLKPAITNTIWDFHKNVWWPLSEQYQVVIYGNANGYEQAFTLPFCDIPMVEDGWDREHPPRFERYLRAMAHHKIWRFWHVASRREKDFESVVKDFHRCLAYGIFPAVYSVQVGGGSIEPYRAYYRQYVPAIETLSRAGWEPIPYARTSDPDVVVERFGNREKGDLHFTFRNYAAAPKKIVVTLDLAALGFIKQNHECLMAYDLLQGPSSLCSGLEDKWEVDVAADGARAFWVGTTSDLARQANTFKDEGLQRIERFYRADLSAQAHTLIAQAKALSLSRAKSAEFPAEAEQFLQVLDKLEPAITTQSTVNRAKVFQRIRAEVSSAVGAAAGILIQASRKAEGFRGTETVVQVRLSNQGKANLTDLNFSLLSPWGDVANGSRCVGAPAMLIQGESAEFKALLFAPAKTERELLPFLIQCRGQSEGRPFTVCAIVDLVLKAPLTVAVSPPRVFRGETSQVQVEIRNALNETARGTLRLGPHPKVKPEPLESAFEVPAVSAQRLKVRLSVEADAHLGDLQLPFSIKSEDARLNLRHFVMLSVGVPAPRVSVQRLNAKPIIDGDLSDSAWQDPPTISELKALRSGEPVSEKTAIWFAYDAEGFYVAFRCLESNMPAIKAEFTQRGAELYKEDDVEFFVQPPGAVSPFQFAINPLGTQSDNFGNKSPWRAAAKRFGDRWTVEVFVPYSCLGLSGVPERGTEWGAQFGRQQKPKAETSSWTTSPAFIIASNFGVLVFE